jgi:hypothetical protein
MAGEGLWCPYCGARVFRTDAVCVQCGFDLALHRSALEAAGQADAAERAPAPASAQPPAPPDLDGQVPEQAPQAIMPADIILGILFCLVCIVLGGLAGVFFGSTLACLFVGVPGFMGEEWGLALAVSVLGGLVGALVGGVIGLVTALRRGRMWVVAIWLVVAVVVLFAVSWGVGSVMIRIKESQLR